MQSSSREYPRLRPVEAIPDPQNARVILRDPTQMAAGMLVVGGAQLALLSLLDGRRTFVEIQSGFARQTGQLLLAHELNDFLDELDRAGFLEGPGFEEYYARLLREYREAPCRPLRDRDGFGAPAASLPAYLDRTLERAREELPQAARNVAAPAGIVTPHLDFPRGRSCYGAGYAALQGHPAPERVVVLGTNHFGRSRSVVATWKDFETPSGVLRSDTDFLDRLQAACGGNLAPYELDHLREHSVELQAVWLHHLFGDGVRIVPLLCPDPSGPRGTRAGDPDGVDLRRFALALGELVREDPKRTLLVASADLSHVGGYFGDGQEIEEPFLEAVRATDEAALAFVDANDPEGLRDRMAETENPTRWCSVGCLYALMTALGADARPQRLRYHRAVTRELQNAVTCAAFAFYR